MNWDAIGALGEVGGAVGVVATLVYLATQVRQNSAQINHNSEAVRASTELENARLSAEWNQEVAGDPELVQLLIAATVGEMSDAQRLRYRFLLASLLYRFEGLYRQWQRGLLPEESWRPWESVIHLMLAPPEARAWWAERMHPFSDSFRELVDRVLSEREAPGTRSHS